MSARFQYCFRHLAVASLSVIAFHLSACDLTVAETSSDSEPASHLEERHEAIIAAQCEALDIRGAPFNQLPPAFLPDDYTRTFVEEPVGNGVSQHVPRLSQQPLLRCGIVDATQHPFDADATGQNDSSDGIRNALQYAKRYGLVTYLPAGTYLVSKPIECIQGLYQRKSLELTSDKEHSCILVGARSATKRTIVQLADAASGFGNSKAPQPLLNFWTRNPANPLIEGGANGYNQIISNVDFKLGASNPGAMAVHLRSAQGSVLEDSTIDATGAYAGVQGGLGSGGSYVNIKVIGGQYGFLLNASQPVPTLIAVSLYDQTVNAIRYSDKILETMVAVGLDIRVPSSAQGPAILAIGPHATSGQISLTDSRITFKSPNPDNMAIATNSSIYLKNVYVRSAPTIVSTSDGGKLNGNATGWRQIVEYAKGVRPPPKKLGNGLWYQYEAPVFVDGVRSEAALLLAGTEWAAPPADLATRHLWAGSFPSWQSPGAVNVKAPPYSAKGDGQTDDGAAIQAAIDDHPIVFVPKGYYRVSKTLRLRPHTRLVGVEQHLSMIVATKTSGGDFEDSSKPNPVIQTADDPNATSVLAFIGVLTPFDVPGAYALSWKSGAQSVFRRAVLRMQPIQGFGNASPGPVEDATHPAVAITDHGAGKFYQLTRDNTGEHHARTYRHVLVRDTVGPLAFYHLNPEDAVSEAEVEIHRSSHVSIYGLKAEGRSPVLWVRDSDQIDAFGYGGYGAAWPATFTYPPTFAPYIPSLFRVERTPNFRLVSLIDRGNVTPGSESYSGSPPDEWHMVLEANGLGLQKPITPLDRPVLYKRGD